MAATRLNSRFYIGDIVHRRYKKTACDKRPSQELPKEEWLYMEAVNEPVISPEIFNAVKSRMEGIRKKKIPMYESRTPVYKGQVAHMYKDIIFCQCGGLMSYRHQGKWAGYRCKDKEHVRPVGCKCRAVRLAEINEAVIDVLNLRFGLGIGYVTGKIVKEYIDRVTVYEGKIFYIELKVDKDE